MPRPPMTDRLGLAATAFVAAWLMLVASADAQRIIFPHELPSTTGLYAPAAPAYPVITAQNAPLYSTPYNYTAPNPTATPTFAPNVSVPPVSAWDPYADPSAAAPLYAAPNPYGAPAYAAPAGVQPYDNPFATLPSTIQGYYQETVRVMQAVRAQHTFLGGNSGTDFDVNTTELSASFGIPAGQIQQPILITPHFNFHWWDGPDSVPLPTPPRDLPAQVYDAFLETSWRPQFTPRVGADLSVSVGVYGDLRYTDKNTVRVTGRGLGLFTLSPTSTIALGVWYINRDRVKLLPSGGILWNPSPDTRYEILFPNPKFSQRIMTYGNADFWGYIAGEYGGGQWTIVHDDSSRDVINYNDMRVIVGVEAIRNNRFRGNFDVGYVFNREILYRNGTPIVNPGDTVMLRMGLQY